MTELEWGARVPFAKPIIGKAEIGAVIAVLSQSILTEGSKTAAFEEAFRDYTGGMAVAVSSCTAALHLSWMALGIGPGDVVIVPALTHAATAHAVLATGARIRICDVGADGNISAETLNKAMDIDISAVCVVHFLGKPVHMPAIMEIAGSKPVVEDCALSLGAKIGDRHVGLFGHTGCFSFYPAKHITTGEGGMVLTTSMSLVKKLRKMRAFGKITDPEFDIIMPGLNYRMGEINAAIGIEQMKRLPGILEARKRNALYLIDALHPRAIGGDYAVSYVAESPDKAKEIRNKLAARSLETSTYYPKPLHRLKYFAERYEADCPMADNISACSVTLPVGPHVKQEKMDVMIETIRGLG